MDPNRILFRVEVIMRLNTVLICAGILILSAIQLFLFRFQRIDNYMLLNRYTGTVHSYMDLMVQPKEISESDKIKSLKEEIIKLQNGQSECLNQINIRDEEIKLLNEIKRRYLSENRKEINDCFKRLSYVIGCYAQSRVYSRISMDNTVYTPEQVMDEMLKSRNKLEELLNNKAPE